MTGYNPLHEEHQNKLRIIRVISNSVHYEIQQRWLFGWFTLKHYYEKENGGIIEEPIKFIKLNEALEFIRENYPIREKIILK